MDYTALIDEGLTLTRLLTNGIYVVIFVVALCFGAIVWGVMKGR